jgi:hypothetical protein
VTGDDWLAAYRERIARLFAALPPLTGERAAEITARDTAIWLRIARDAARARDRDREAS